MILSKPFLEYQNYDYKKSFNFYLQMLKEDYIPEWMDLDIIYLFKINPNF